MILQYIYIYIYTSTYLPIHLSINLSIYLFYAHGFVSIIGEDLKFLALVDDLIVSVRVNSWDIPCLGNTFQAEMACCGWKKNLH